jgi:hypothetical protein
MTARASQAPASAWSTASSASEPRTARAARRRGQARPRLPAGRQGRFLLGLPWPPGQVKRTVLPVICPGSTMITNIFMIMKSL